MKKNNYLEKLLAHWDLEINEFATEEGIALQGLEEYAFTDYHGDGYYDIRINDRTQSGALLKHLFDYVRVEEDFSVDVTVALLCLVMNRDLTFREKKTVKDMITICNYAYDNDDELYEHVKSVAKFDAWSEYYMIPARLCLFLWNADGPKVIKFWDDCKAFTKEILDVAGVVNKYTRKKRGHERNFREEIFQTNTEERLKNTNLDRLFDVLQEDSEENERLDEAINRIIDFNNHNDNPVD